jgi:hypothetical protein
MNICVNDWNGIVRCTGGVMQRLHEATPGGAEGSWSMMLLLLASIIWFVFRSPT